ncbi:MAG: bifunctional metallophosphatase/5'-nucleotidase [Polyangiaceae bacterium]|nr:bifunctional metallophosphatase/5'-nucleotidase [Polyangiaceae bacterium]
MGFRRLAVALTALYACSPPVAGGRADAAQVSAPVASASAPAGHAAGPRVITVVGTNDLHGRVAALPLLAGYVSRLRATRAKDGGVLLVDAGDMFQGTLESNLAEGLPIVKAYGAMGYGAVTIGNHEFDFGPAGPDATPRSPDQDPRGALKAAAKAAPFPFLAANVIDESTKKPVDWPNVKPSTMVDVAGVKIGLIGITTQETLETTISANVKGLSIMPLAKAVGAEASRLRQAGAEVVVVLSHAGGKCKTFTGDIAADQCEDKSEAFELARALPPGAIDVIVAGHSHAGVAHEVAGVAIIEQFSNGRAFGRVDLTIADGRVAQKKIFAPRDLCPGTEKADPATCDPGQYEGGPIERDAQVATTIAPAIESAKEKRASLIGPDLPEGMKRDYHDESALGNLFADLVREARPGADIGLMNGGGLRADLPKGPLSYGSLFEAFPFDNRLAVAELTGKELRELVRTHLKKDGGILSFSGVTVSTSCKDGSLEVSIERAGKKRKVADDEKVVIVGSDFLFTGGDGFWGELKPPHVEILDELMRDALERGLKQRKSIAPSSVFDPKKPRLKLVGRRPIQCKG